MDIISKEHAAEQVPFVAKVIQAAFENPKKLSSKISLMVHGRSAMND